MTFRGLFLALRRRDLGRQPIVVLIAWLLLGAGAAVARQWLAAEQLLDDDVIRRLGTFEGTLATVLGFAAAHAQSITTGAVQAAARSPPLHQARRVSRLLAR